MGKVLEPAFVLGRDFTPRPQLVSRASVTSKEPFTVTFEIHPAARWSDRVPVTARDLVFTHRAIVAHRREYADHQAVRSVSRLGTKTVGVVFRARKATWRFLFPFVLPAHVLEGEDLSKIWSGGIDDPKTGAPIGSGPFLVRNWRRGDQMTFVRNRNYWGPHPAYLDSLVLRFCRSCGRQLTPSAELLEAFRRNEVDLMHTRDTAILGELRRIPGVKARLAPLSGLDYLFLRLGPGGHPALKTKLIRRALAYGIDRVALARSALGELYERVGVSDNAVLMRTSRFYRPNWERYRHRPALARRLLEQAGCRLGADRIYVCGGQRLSLRFFAPIAAAHRVRVVRLMAEHLRPIGVDVKVAFVPAQVIFTQIAPSGDFDGLLFAYFNAPDVLGASIHGCAGSFNVTGYCQRLVTADLNESELIVDVEQRVRVLNRADARIALDVPLIPLFRVPNVIAFRTNIRNVGSAADHELWNAENWWLDD
jgi:peptide/nickel transport system substrate-binding protein